MGLEAAAALARNVAAIVFAAAAVLAAIALLSGGVGLTVGLAGAFVIVSLAALATFSFAGLLTWLAGASLGWIGIVTAALVLTGAFLGGHWFGVRGLWAAALGACGAGLAWVFFWAFGRELPQPFGVVGPMAAFALLALLSFGALGALSQAARHEESARAERARSPADDEAGGSGRFSLLALATPPAWFDCAYAALGGQGEAPGQCALTPPSAAEERSAAAVALTGAPDETPTRPEADRRPEDPESEIAPATVQEPAAPILSTPVFDRERAGAVTASAAPEDVLSAAEEDRPPPAQETDAPASETAPPLEPDQPALVAVEVDAAPETADTAPPPSRALAPEIERYASADGGLEPTVDAPERRRSALVCFPMQDAVAERLCPDERLGPRDVEVIWRESGGEAQGAAEAVECYIDQDLTPHATLAVHLSGSLLGSIGRGGGLSGREPMADAIYDAATRLIGGVRAAEPSSGGARLLMSLYLINGSSLMSPWASQDFGVGREDRLFDLRVGGQTLALLRRLKDELQTLRSDRGPGDLAAGLIEAVEARPRAEGTGVQPLLALVIDTASARMNPADRKRVIEAFREAGAPFFAFELGAHSVSDTLRNIAEATGGAAFAASDAAKLEILIESALLRARSFCTVKVSAPESFFESGALEIRLRRQLRNSCVFEQVAQLDCARLTISERIETLP